MKFVDRFRATASMVTTSGRWNLLPVVNHTPYQLPAVWRLEPSTLRLPLKRLLPYCKARTFSLVACSIVVSCHYYFIINIFLLSSHNINDSPPELHHMFVKND